MSLPMALPRPPIDDKHTERRATFVSQVNKKYPKVTAAKLMAFYDDVCVRWAVLIDLKNKPQAKDAYRFIVSRNFLACH
jgi:hypothetical protein